MTEESAEQKLARYEYVLDAYMAELDKLRAENERLIAAADAHATLRAIYTNPALSETARLKAAAASLPFEKPKLMSTPPPLELTAETVVIPLAELVAARRARQDRMCPESKALDLVPVVPRRNGDGGDEAGGK